MSRPLFGGFRRSAVPLLRSSASLTRTSTLTQTATALATHTTPRVNWRRHSVTAWTRQDLTRLVSTLTSRRIEPVAIIPGTQRWNGFRRRTVRSFTSQSGAGSSGGDDRAGINLPSDATEEQWREVVALRGQFAGRQRELASAVVTWAADNYPNSIASYIAADFETVVGYVGNTAAAQIGDYFLGDLVNLCADPTAERVIAIAKGETVQWLNTPGIAGWFGSMMDAQGRLSIYVERVGLAELGFSTSYNSEGYKEYHHPDYPELTMVLRAV
jgi:hypothetical protein